jgi:hypothetical protein
MLENQNNRLRRAVGHPEDRPFVDEIVILAEKADFEFDHRIITADGSMKHVHSVAHPVFDDSGELVEYLGTIIDVTERRRADEALRQAQADLAYVSRVKVQGTGMALTISRSIIESHGGRLWDDGNAPRGASFHFTLPPKLEAHEWHA